MFITINININIIMRGGWAKMSDDICHRLQKWQNMQYNIYEKSLKKLNK